MGSAEIDRILINIIDTKYKELELYKMNNGLFSKIRYFEANAIGQIGEQFVKQIFKLCKIPIVSQIDRTIHDEYDILLKSGAKVEVKTARLGKHNTYQFNGLNPLYNYNYIILIGISTIDVKYLIIEGKVLYNHKRKKPYLVILGKEKNLVSMNPGDDKNLKLTLNDKVLKDINSIKSDIKKMIK